MKVSENLERQLITFHGISASMDVFIFPHRKKTNAREQLSTFVILNENPHVGNSVRSDHIGLFLLLKA